MALILLVGTDGFGVILPSIIEFQKNIKKLKSFII